MMKKSRAVIITALLLLLAGLVGIAYAHTIQQEANDRYKSEIEALEEALKATDLPVEVRRKIEQSLETVKLMATHRASVIQYYTQVAAGEVTPKPTEKYATLDPNTISKIPDGIDDHPIIPRPIPGPDDSAILNAWRKTTPERRFVVLSGYVIPDREQGMVLLKKPNSIFFLRYLTPRKSGPVRIVEEHGLYLVLKAESGDTFYFDALGERFIDSLDAPTITPTPIERIEAGTPAPPYPAP